MLAQLRCLTAVSCRAVTPASATRRLLTSALSTRTVAQMAEAGNGHALPEVVETKGVPVSSTRAVTHSPIAHCISQLLLLSVVFTSHMLRSVQLGSVLPVVVLNCEC